MAVTVLVDSDSERLGLLEFVGQFIDTGSLLVSESPADNEGHWFVDFIGEKDQLHQLVDIISEWDGPQ